MNNKTRLALAEIDGWNINIGRQILGVPADPMPLYNTTDDLLDLAEKVFSKKNVGISLHLEKDSQSLATYLLIDDDGESVSGVDIDVSTSWAEGIKNAVAQAIIERSKG